MPIPAEIPADVTTAFSSTKGTSSITRSVGWAA